MQTYLIWCLRSTVNIFLNQYILEKCFVREYCLDWVFWHLKTIWIHFWLFFLFFRRLKGNIMAADHAYLFYISLPVLMPAFSMSVSTSMKLEESLHPSSHKKKTTVLSFRCTRGLNNHHWIKEITHMQRAIKCSKNQYLVSSQITSYVYFQNQKADTSKFNNNKKDKYLRNIYS